MVVDATAIRLGGGLSYVTRQLRGVERVAPDLDVRVVSAPWNDAALREALDLPVEPSGVRSTRGRLVHEQFGLPRHVPSGAVLHCPGNLAPILPVTITSDTAAEDCDPYSATIWGSSSPRGMDTPESL